MEVLTSSLNIDSTGKYVIPNKHESQPKLAFKAEKSDGFLKLHRNIHKEHSWCHIPGFSYPSTWKIFPYHIRHLEALSVPQCQERESALPVATLPVLVFASLDSLQSSRQVHRTRPTCSVEWKTL
ncbi:hypothetical protein ElyMa_006707000 [Elysia marginata]|uniref:Uncharacterized protein n=1 Tax=Elysia marginata TaxID=1093978 RepID=A0AAV4ISL5_9GAST|nr:hypothetical protein ElyMa_006707000 [Elysia marginata]